MQYKWLMVVCILPSISYACLLSIVVPFYRRMRLRLHAPPTYTFTFWCTDLTPLLFVYRYNLNTNRNLHLTLHCCLAMRKVTLPYTVIAAMCRFAVRRTFVCRSCFNAICRYMTLHPQRTVIDHRLPLHHDAS